MLFTCGDLLVGDCQIMSEVFPSFLKYYYFFIFCNWKIIKVKVKRPLLGNGQLTV